MPTYNWLVDVSDNTNYHMLNYISLDHFDLAILKKLLHSLTIYQNVCTCNSFILKGNSWKFYSIVFFQLYHGASLLINSMQLYQHRILKTMITQVSDTDSWEHLFSD